MFKYDFDGEYTHSDENTIEENVRMDSSLYSYCEC